VNLRSRERIPELMDSPTADPRVLDGALQTLEILNRLPFGGTLGTSRLQRAIEESKLASVQVADIGSGGGDAARRLVLWGRRRGIGVRCVGLDRSCLTSVHARHRTEDDRVRFVAGDAARLPFGDGSLDFLHAALLVHHLEDERAVVAFFREALRVCRRACIVNDLVRSRTAYVIVRLATSLSTNPYIRHDGPASVRNAYVPRELEALAREAGWRSVQIEKRLAHRMCVVLRKEAV
jgi:ubiquinone/menaquinone biosynthesis C-methylase UbiE